MYKTFIHIILFFSLLLWRGVGGETIAQNLLLNGDFEDYTSCPTSESSNLQNPLEITKCIGWTAPTYGTSDYLNTCSSSSTVSLPINSFGYQQPYSGSGCLGGYFISLDGGTGTDGYNGTMWWEYIQGQFITSLKANQIYQIKLYISLTDWSDLSIKEFGAYISVNAISSPNTANLTVEPQVKFAAPTYFNDTANWVAVEGLYMASGGEQYITIGNFKSDIDIDTLRLRLDDPPDNYSYYLIDAAETIDVTGDVPISNVFSPNGDGMNDVWQLPFTLSGYQINIYNRWGNLIIKANAFNFSWNGKTKNKKKCSDGVYYYLITNNNNTSKPLKGFIQLLRQ